MNIYLLALFGGILIGLSAVMLMAVLGRITGISGIASNAILGTAVERPWRLSFLAGLLLAPLLLLLLRGDSGIGAPVVSLPWMALAGLIVGVGTRIGSGCTSGHGVCGTARLSPRSLLATATFVVLGMATVYVVRHVLGGA